MANCVQTGELVRQISCKTPGDVLSYADLWRLTLENYNAGRSCIQEVLWEVKKARDPIDWPNVAQAQANLEACGGAIEFVEHATKIYP